MSSTDAGSSPRDLAIARLKAKRAFQISLVTYLAVNALLVIIWLITRDNGDGFWPIWVIVFWGVGLVAQGWHAYGPRWGGITESDIDREMKRMQ